MQIENTLFTFMTQFARKNIFNCCLLLNRTPNYPYRMPCTIFSCSFFCYKEKIFKFEHFFARNCPFYLEMLDFSSLNRKMGFKKPSLNQTFYVLKFWEQWNSSLNRKTSLNRTCLNRKFTVLRLLQKLACFVIHLRVHSRSLFLLNFLGW